MLGLERLALILERDPCPASGHVLQGQVGGVAAVAEHQHVLSAGLDALEQRVDGHAGPLRIELRPGGDAVDVDREILAGERLELVPAPAPGLVKLPPERERPFGQRHPRRGPGREHGKVRRDVLAGRYPVRVRLFRMTPVEAAGDVHGDLGTYRFESA